MRHWNCSAEEDASTEAARRFPICFGCPPAETTRWAGHDRTVKGMLCVRRWHATTVILGRRCDHWDVAGLPTVRTTLVAVAGRGANRPPAVEEVQAAAQRPVGRWLTLLESVEVPVAAAAADQADRQDGPLADASSFG